jgi:hypothetical protein
MTVVPSVTAHDYGPHEGHLPRLAPPAGLTLELLVLAFDGQHCAGVDLGTGALVRAWSLDPPTRRIVTYDVVAVTLADNDDAVPDPAEPEALALAGPPTPVRRLSRWRTERLLRPLVHPAGKPLLDLHTPAVPFWERRSDHPSIGLVEPRGPVGLWRDGSYLACRFIWQGLEHELPCLDRRLASEMDRSGRTFAPGPRRARLLVCLTAPIDGRCHKVVEAILPRP